MYYSMNLNRNISSKYILNSQNHSISMNKKSWISVNTMLQIAIAVILVIGVLATAQLFFPWVLTGFTCPQLQRQNIDEVITIIEEVMLTGDEQIVKFKVESCTKCIWLKTMEDDPSNFFLIVEFESTEESVSTPVVWNGIDTDSDCTDHGGVLVGEKACVIDIKYNSVEVTC